MMEIKQKSPITFNDLVSSRTDSNGVVEGVVNNLKEANIKPGLLKTNDFENDLLKSSTTHDNNDQFDDGGIIDLDNIDFDEPMNSELEDALLADDEPEEIENNNTNSSNKALSSNQTRNPGDDLDTLLSKLSDLEDCIEKKGVEEMSTNTTIPNPTVKENLKDICGKDNESKILEKENANGKDDCIVDQTNSEKSNDSVQMKSPDKCDTIILEDSLDIVDADDDQEHKQENKQKENKLENNLSKDNLEIKQNELNKTVDSIKEQSTNALVNDIDGTQSTVDLASEKGKEAEKTNENNQEAAGDCLNTESNESAKDGDKKNIRQPNSENTEKNIPTVILDDDGDEIPDQTNTVNELDAKKNEEKEMKKSSNETKVSDSIDIDDDDDVIFLSDKVDATVTSSTEAKIPGKTTIASKVHKVGELTDHKDESKKENKEQEITMKESKSPSHSNGDDDEDIVVVLCDDSSITTERPGHKNIKTNDQTATKKTNANLAEGKEVGQEEKLEFGSNTPAATVEQKSGVSVDNSDNARTDFEVDKDNADEKDLKSKTLDTEETTSNCSSSSNLLQEAKSRSPDETCGEGEEEEEAEAEPEPEPEPEDADGDVEVIEDVTIEDIKVGENEDKESQPPAKRMRLSQEQEDEKQLAINDDSTTTSAEKTEESMAEAEVIESNLDVNQQICASPAAVKRPHNSEHDDKESEQEEDSGDSLRKKTKIETTIDEETSNIVKADDDNNLESMDGNSSLPPMAGAIEEVDVKKEEDVKLLFQAVPSRIPISLYPPPKFEENPAPLSLEFFQRFKKSFAKMTKNDIEELILQKIVEAIVHKSEFADMRDVIEKLEKTIGIQRTKISDLSKQFRDLEMVHNRVIKDMEAKTSQIVMPVKITRAVGLQVHFPAKKTGDVIANSTVVTPVVNTVTATNRVPTSPQNKGIHATAQQYTSPQRFNNTESTSVAFGARFPTVPPMPSGLSAPTVRRGVMQKVTPQRPVEPSASNATANAYRNQSPTTTPQVMQTLPVASTKILNKSMALANIPGQRNRGIAPSQQLHQPQVLRLPTQNVNLRKIAPKASPVTGSLQHQYRRVESTTIQTAAPLPNSTPVENYINSLNQLSPGVSITAAKPKDKSIIDLTDEDDAALAAKNSGPLLTKQRLPVQAFNANTTSSFISNRTAVPLGRLPTVNQATKQTVPPLRHLPTVQGQKVNGNSLPTTITNPSGTSIARVQVTSSNPGTQRMKNNHPAPLPHTPPQPYNPSWKLPPPRPTIRISNVDNGIVISWTMEESMELYDECVSYQIYAYQETSGSPTVDSWRHVGDVKAMLLPMAVTLTQFQEGQRYYFAVRAVDAHQRYGAFSMPKTWS